MACVDFGRGISRDEQSEFKVKATVAGGTGKEYPCIASMPRSSMIIPSGRNTYELGPTIFFFFDVEPSVSNCSFKFEDCLSVDLGNPFSQPIYSP